MKCMSRRWGYQRESRTKDRQPQQPPARARWGLRGSVELPLQPSRKFGPRLAAQSMKELIVH
jgi:hypothetical protein